MKQWLTRWQGFSQSERRSLLLLIGVLTVCLGYYGVYAPLHQAVVAAQARVKAQHNLRDWAMTTGEKILALQATHPQVKDQSGSVQAIVNRTSGQYQISISRLQAQDNELILSLDKVNFDQSMLWLTQLDRAYGIKVRLMDMQRLPVAGQVMVRRLVLGRE